MGADFYPNRASEEPQAPFGIEDNVILDSVLVDKNVLIGKGARIIASEAPSGLADADYEHVSMRDGIAVIPKQAKIPEGWSLKDQKAP